MAKLTRSFPFLPFFTLLGLVTFALFLLHEAVGPEVRDTAFGQVLVNVLQVIIIPQWLMRTLVVMVGGLLFGFGGGFPIWYDVLSIPVLLLPYFLADILFANSWRQIARYRRLRVER